MKRSLVHSHLYTQIFVPVNVYVYVCTVVHGENAHTSEKGTLALMHPGPQIPSICPRGCRCNRVHKLNQKPDAVHDRYNLIVEIALKLGTKNNATGQ